jgi:glycosyltransferase involved in cell wall biosynthesis
MAISDCIISLSTDPEAFGRVSLEALALGKPVAAYDHGGVAEQLNALLPQGKLPLGNTDLIAQKLEQWYRSPPTLAPDPQEFSLHKMLRKTFTIYSEATHS